jgi:hypothetical protein
MAMNFAPPIAFCLFPAMLLLFESGYRLRLRRPASISSTPIEGIVFGLLGLLLAFTFSGAVARYDTHRQLLTQEVNSIGSVYLRLDLLPPPAQPAFRQLLRDYTRSRLHLFRTVGPEVSPISTRLQTEIWRRTVIAAASHNANPDATKLLLPSLNDMFDITVARQNAFYMHPPEIVFLLLFGFGCGCAFLTGYSTKSEQRDRVYAVALAATVTLTVYVTLEVEFPRQGFIRFTQLDQPLISLLNSMK